MAGDKYLYNNSGTVTEKAAIQSSTGAGDAGKIIAADASGKLDPTFLPAGVQQDLAVITASEALAAGDFVNVHNSSGAKVRKADGSTSGKEAHGFVLAAVSNGASATVYFEGINTGVSGQTPGVVYLSNDTAGLAESTAPASAGQTVQRLGVAISATAINFEPSQPITLA